MKKSIPLFIIFCLILTACYSQEQVVEEVPPLVQLKEVVESPETYLGKKIWIEGQIGGSIGMSKDPGSNVGTVFWLLHKQPAYIVLNRQPSCLAKFNLIDGQYSVRVIEEKRNSYSCDIENYVSPLYRIMILGILKESKEAGYYFELLSIY